MPFLGGIFSTNNTAGRQAGEQASRLANNELWGGENRALGQYGTNYYDPYTQTGNAANTMYSNALGLNGQQGNQAATSAFQASPGYNFATQQGIQALDRSAAGSGMFGSGNAAMALNNYGQGMANQQYGNWLSGLSGLNNQGLQAAGGQTGRQGALAGINQWGAGGRAQNLYNGTYQGQTADAGQNAQGGANLWNAIAGGLSLLGGLSDRRAKTDIELLGKEPTTELPIYAYRYKNDPKTFPKIVGPMAQDIEKRRPDLVREIGGHKIISGNWLTEMARAA